MSLANHIKIPDAGIPLIRIIEFDEFERMLHACTPPHEVGPITEMRLGTGRFSGCCEIPVSGWRNYVMYDFPILSGQKALVSCRTGTILSCTSQYCSILTVNSKYFKNTGIGKMRSEKPTIM